MHDSAATNTASDEVRAVIKKCLETAALVNYTKLSEETKIEGRIGIYNLFHASEWPLKVAGIGSLRIFSEDLRGETMVSPSKKLDDLIHLAELCVDLLQQNEEHYAEVRKFYFCSVSLYSPDQFSVLYMYIYLYNLFLLLVKAAMFQYSYYET